jgi:glucosyltransferase Lgt1/2/3
MSYTYNPHRHVKIWFSNNPNYFMNFENQMRLIELREQNFTDEIHLVFDSALLNPSAQERLNSFCTKHRITPIDAARFDMRTLTSREQELYTFYKDEITHLEEGGSLAVASDLLRWLKPVYSKGTYTDFDVPVDTSGLPEVIAVQTPLLLNIGSLHIRNKETVLVNNDFIAVVDLEGAEEAIKKIQDGFIQVLGHYSNDFIERIEHELGEDNLINPYLLKVMRNRPEAIYIQRSITQFHKASSSRELRGSIKEIMTNKQKYLHFSQLHAKESKHELLQRLRRELISQQSFIKWIFFRNEYLEAKSMLLLDDEAFIQARMKKERSLYLKSVVVCTTGPLSLSKVLFGGYVFDAHEFTRKIKPFSFNNYYLKKAFQSQNSIPLHENFFGMLHFLGAEEGRLNDSSWLEEGIRLQKCRELCLKDKQAALIKELQDVFNA